MERVERDAYRKGVLAAKADLLRGVLGYEDIQCSEAEDTYILWCYQHLLTTKYDLDYRIICPSSVPPAVGRKNGYNSVAEPLVNAKLGSDWKKRIYSEAETYYRKHRKFVIAQCNAYYERKKQEREPDLW